MELQKTTANYTSWGLPYCCLSDVFNTLWKILSKNVPPGSEHSLCALTYKVEMKIVWLLGHANKLGAMLIKANATSSIDWWQNENTTKGSLRCSLRPLLVGYRPRNCEPNVSVLAYWLMMGRSTNICNGKRSDSERWHTISWVERGFTKPGPSTCLKYR